MDLMDDKQFLFYLNGDFPQLKATQYNLDQPTAEFVSKYYTLLMTAVTQMSTKALCDFTNEQREFLHGLGNDASIANHISKVNFYKMVKYVFDCIGLSNFHYSDIIFPHLSKHRCLIFMKSMFAFYATCIEFDQCYEELHEENDNVNLLAQLKVEQNQLKERLSQKKASKVLLSEKINANKKKLSEYADEHEKVQYKLRELENFEAMAMEKVRQLEEDEMKEHALGSKLEEEKRQLESLIVPNEDQMLDYHGKLQSQRQECVEKLQFLETRKTTLSTKLGHFDRILSLQENLASTLKKEILFGNETYDLRGLAGILPSLKNDYDKFAKEEVEIASKIKTLIAVTAEKKDELSRLLENKNSVTCVWNERLEKYKMMIRDLELALLESKGLCDVIPSTLKASQQEAAELRVIIENKTSDLIGKHQAFKDKCTKLEKAIMDKLVTLKKDAECYLLSNQPFVQ